MGRLATAEYFFGSGFIARFFYSRLPCHNETKSEYQQNN